MLSSLGGFVSRHRKKFIAGGVLIGGTVFAIHYVEKKLRSFQEKQTRELIEKTRQNQHFESTERTINQAIAGLSPNLCDEILNILQTDNILEKLRKNPDNKLELWEELKVISFTRLTTLIYASSMLIVTLRVQLNLLGGYMYKEAMSDKPKLTNEVREAYLSSIQYFLKEGVSDLARLIETKVRSILKSYTLTQKLRLTDIEQIFWSIQMAVNSDPEEPSGKITKYVLPHQVIGKDLLNQMNNETLDMLESDDVAILCSNNVSRGFTIAVDSIAEPFVEVARESTPPSDGGEGEHEISSPSKVQLNSIININNIELHLAKLIPIVSGITGKTFDTNVKPPNFATSLITLYLVSDKLKTLGANVYEVFSV